jgi:PPOX class probable F420-dependent enzyme
VPARQTFYGEVMGPDERRSRLASARVGRLATVSADGEPHVVPVVFAVVGDVLYTAVDGKPKTTRRLRRLADVEATGRAGLLVDEYDEDWSALWWVRVDGAAEVLEPCSTEERQAVVALVGKYAQYAGAAPAGPVIALRIRRWRSWAYDGR